MSVPSDQPTPSGASGHRVARSRARRVLDHRGVGVRGEGLGAHVGAHVVARGAHACTLRRPGDARQAGGSQVRAAVTSAVTPFARVGSITGA